MILRLLIIVLIAVPIIEIWGLLQVSDWIGAWPTLLAVIATGVIGGYLAKQQGLRTLHLIQLQIQQRQMPGQPLLDGLCILAGGVLLLTPGFFTDALGFVLLIPVTRGIIQLGLKRFFQKHIRSGTIITIFPRR